MRKALVLVCLVASSVFGGASMARAADDPSWTHGPVTVTINPGYTVTPDGLSTGTGSVTCTEPVTVNVQGSLIQPTGPNTASSYASGYFYCYGAETLTWVVSTYSTTGTAFRPGHATIEGSFSYSSESGYHTVPFEMSAVLRPAHD
jgi:hypothetical protein